jgi:hypothetical protein
MQDYRESGQLKYGKPFCGLCKTKNNNASYSTIIAMANTWDHIIVLYACGYCVTQSTRKYLVHAGPDAVKRALARKLSYTRDLKFFASRTDFGRTPIGGFAIRTMKNLEFLVSAYEQGADVHPITQMVLSLLGLIVFPWEADFSVVAQDDLLKRYSLRDLEEQHMWPHWEITRGETETNTLHDLIRHVRNATAHRRLTFSEEYKRELSEVYITFEDKKLKDQDPYWTATINAENLRKFCVQFVDLLLVEAYYQLN